MGADAAARIAFDIVLDPLGRPDVAAWIADPAHRVNVRVINELAWHNLFIRTMLVRPQAHELEGFAPEYTIIDLPSFKADPQRHGCRSNVYLGIQWFVLARS